jgi:hypothetical protein
MCTGAVVALLGAVVAAAVLWDRQDWGSAGVGGVMGAGAGFLIGCAIHTLWARGSSAAGQTSRAEPGAPADWPRE